METSGLRSCDSFSKNGSCEKGDTCPNNLAHKTCRYGLQCKKRDTCAFFHKELRECRWGAECRNQPNCPFVHKDASDAAESTAVTKVVEAAETT